jgi:hypothetical protein
MRWQGEIVAVTVEATTGWRWVVRELRAASTSGSLIPPSSFSRPCRGDEARADRGDPPRHPDD